MGFIGSTRCPFCGESLRTPEAKQCRFCKHDWHDGSQHGYSNQEQSAKERRTPPSAGRCPYCAKPLRTLQAKQCRFCKKDWHDGRDQGYSDTKNRSNEDNRQTEEKRSVWTIAEACRTLDISGDLTLTSVRTAYRKAIVQWHPDRLEGLAPELIKLATQRTVELNRAYELILSSLK